MGILRRTASVLALAAVALALPAAAPAEAAQGAPGEGSRYVRLTRPQPVATPGKREVLEFFWYGCPHSRLLEQPLADWAARQPKDVVVRRVPAVTAGEPASRGQARLYYALERLGLVGRLQRAAFRAVVEQHHDLADEATAAEWATRHGVDRRAFLAAYESAEVGRRTAAAPALLERYQVPELPSVVVQGRYRTAPTLTDGVEGVMPVVDRLVRGLPGPTN
jgi:protein dithiol oxidoreductase (disulfide-forming)